MPMDHGITSYEFSGEQVSHPTLRDAIEYARYNDNIDQIDIRLPDNEFITLERGTDGKWVLTEIQPANTIKPYKV